MQEEFKIVRRLLQMMKYLQIWIIWESKYFSGNFNKMNGFVALNLLYVVNKQLKVIKV